MKTFIEIGSCDFNTLNHLSDFGWRGLIVDPMKKYLDNIERKPNIEYINIAISNKFDTMDLHVFKDEIVNSDSDFRGMSTLNPNDYVLEHNMTDTVKVNVIPYEKLLEYSGVTRVDYLKIDTEGHDYTILTAINFNAKTRPAFIKVEHQHCDRDQMVDFLKNVGYDVHIEDMDLYAIDLLNF